MWGSHFLDAGFDTASSIALLTISALAKNGKNNTRIAPSDVVILPVRASCFLFISRCGSCVWKAVIHRRDDLGGFA